ncbi:NAD(P)/FAD-dependent oxidoreductase [Bosea sp. 117]|uniref:NAD(P)/FAD-dependent oxidoreductase n=1 Tax=Bosea sp. 117 TaxID=1125973 RepID=UPI000493E267|nr:NAD(P)/FAD-dependent oxidoreductase [Bosea sp. 117]
MARVAVIGAGAMGLAAAYHALKAGHEVTVYEADSVPGGMAAHFDFGGLSIERYYHFVCKSDRPTFALMDELGIGDKMRWVPTSMGYFIDGRLHDWGNPVALLKFPGLSFVEKLRYGLMMFLSTKRAEAGDLEKRSAREWIESWCGPSVYQRLWRPLFDLKFYEYADNISAAWIWTRIKRIGTSRRSLMQEELGYIDGGTLTLVEALSKAIRAKGGDIRLGAKVEEIVSEGGRVTGVKANGAFEPYDAVIATVPTPLIPKLVPGFSDAAREAYAKIENIGVACLIFKLKRSVTPHFWVNTMDARMGIPGFVEFSNLRPTGDTIVYVPYYMPVTNRNWARPDAELLDEAFSYLKMVNPALTDADRIDARVGRLAHAQPVCPPGFAAMIPPVATEIAGLQIADTCFYYPEDRGISESVRYGELMARAVNDPAVWKGAH